MAQKYSDHDLRPLNAALRESVNFIQAEGWDKPATLFALVPAELLGDILDDEEMGKAPYALVVQEDMPEHIQPGSEELGDFLSTIRWPEHVVGAILAQEIMFKDSSNTSGEGSEPQAARLFSGVINDGPARSLLQLRPTQEQLDADPFGQDDVTLLGADNIAPGVIAVLRHTFEDDYDPDAEQDGADFPEL